MENWSLEQLAAREQQLVETIAETEAAMQEPGNYVSRKCLAWDRALLRTVRAELRKRLKVSKDRR